MKRTTVAVATRQGTSEDNADRTGIETLADGTVAVAVVDGIGHGAAVTGLAELLASVSVRIAARDGALAGICTAARLIGTPRSTHYKDADAVGVVAVISPDGDAAAAWVGDCAGYGFDGKRLRRYTTPHTVGRQLEENGAPWRMVRRHENWVRTSFGRCSLATTFVVRIPDKLRIFVSDGVTDQVKHAVLTEIVRQNADDPARLAHALVGAARASRRYRDDATAVVALTLDDGHE